MKIIYILLLCFFVFSCNHGGALDQGDQKAEDIKTISDSSNKFDYSISLTKDEILNLMQGVWAENEQYNALFFIQNDSLFYIEDQDKPNKLTFYSNNFIINGDIPVKCKILKISKDSLIYIDEFNDEVTFLYKRH